MLVWIVCIEQHNTSYWHNFNKQGIISIYNIFMFQILFWYSIITCNRTFKSTHPKSKFSLASYTFYILISLNGFLTPNSIRDSDMLFKLAISDVAERSWQHIVFRNSPYHWSKHSIVVFPNVNRSVPPLPTNECNFPILSEAP